MDLNLFVYGNGDFIYDILTSVNFFMNHAKSFFSLAALLSLVMFAVESTGMMPTRGYDWSKFMKVYLLISIFVMTPYPGKINVHDVITNQDRVFNFRSGKLPFGLIFPIATVSTVMNRLITLYQQNFEIDENLNYTYSGMNFGANFIQSLDNVDSYDANFNFNLDQYMQNCGFPLINKAGALSELRTSPDVFATLAKYTSVARFVQQVDFASSSAGLIVTPCNQAITQINNYYETNKDKILHNNAQRIGISGASGYDRFLNSANATASTLLNISQGAATALKQAIGMNMIMASLKNGAQGAGNGTLALAAYDAEQFQQYKTTSVLSGAASARTIPVLVAIGFALLFFIYPIMIFLAISMGSYKAIGVFFQLVIGINLIPLIYEILNYITTFYLEKKLGVVISGQGFSYDVSTSLYSFTDNMIVAGNYLATATPLIAYAIVTGSSMALTSVFSHINDPAKSQANSVGHEYALGNQNIGNTSIDTHSFNTMQGNKLDDQFSMNSGSPIMKTTTPGGVNTNVAGQNYDVNYKSDLLATPNFAQMASSSLENRLSHSKEQMGSLSKQWGQQSQRLHDLSNSIQSGQDSSISGGSEEAKAIQHTQELASNIQATLGAGAMGSSASGQVSSSSSDTLNHNLNEYQRYSNSLSHSSDKAVRDAFSNSNSLTTSSSNTIQEAVSTSQALSDVNTNQSSINTNFSNDFNEHLRSHGFEPTDMSASVQTAEAQQFVADKLNSQYGLNTDLHRPSASSSGIDKLGSQASGNINSNGIAKPDSITATAVPGGKLNNKVTDAVRDFSDNQGNMIGNQVIEQSQTIGNVNKNIAQLGGEVVKKIFDNEE
jgi:conjugal transfer mating pair stabilization protein TraG